MVNERAETVRSLALRLGMLDPDTFQRLPMGNGDRQLGKTTAMLLGVLADLVERPGVCKAVVIVAPDSRHAHQVASTLRGWGEKLNVVVPLLYATTAVEPAGRVPITDNVWRYYDHSCFE